MENYTLQDKLVELSKDEDLDKLKKELNDDTDLTVFNILDKARTTTKIRAKWLLYRQHEKELYKGWENLEKEYLGKLVNNQKQSSILSTKNKSNIYENDEKMKKIVLEKDKCKARIDFIEMVMNILSDFGFTVKNTIEAYKLEK